MYGTSTNSSIIPRNNYFLESKHSFDLEDIYDSFKNSYEQQWDILKKASKNLPLYNNAEKDMKNIQEGEIFRFMLYLEFIKSNTALDEISKLKDNWNNNGAKAFSAKHIKICRDILNSLTIEPFVSPTACDSIQFEYEKDNGDYLEFEIYEDRIEVYEEKENQEPKDWVMSNDKYLNKIRQMVVDFYG